MKHHEKTLSPSSAQRHLERRVLLSAPILASSLWIVRPCKLKVMSTLKAVRGTRDLSAAGDGPVEPHRGHRAHRLCPLQLRRNSHADLRRHAALRPRRGRRNRHRLEGDVHVGGSRPRAVGESRNRSRCGRKTQPAWSGPTSSTSWARPASCRSSTTSARSSAASVRRRAATASSRRSAPRSSARPPQAANRPLRDAEVLEMLATLAR